MKKEFKGPCFEEIFSVENLLKAHLQCRKSKQHKREVISFEMNLATNLVRLNRELVSGTYKIPAYRKFYIKEPKLRLIESLPYRHRIVQRAFCEVLFKPTFERHFIFDNAACRKGKGTHFALERLKKFMLEFRKKNKGGYFVVCDIKKYFPNINHEILFQKLGNFGFDARTMALIRQYLDSSGKEAGLPIGNQVSQWFALLFLDEFDKFAKCELKQKFYIRYMDDFVMFFEDKAQIEPCLQKVRQKLGEVDLVLKDTQRMGKLKNGIPFLGFASFAEKNFYRRICPQARDKMKHNLRLLRFVKKTSVLDEEFVHVKKSCYLAHLAYAHEHSLQSALFCV